MSGKRFCDMLRETRESRKLTVKECAKYARVSQDRWRAFERGEAVPEQGTITKVFGPGHHLLGKIPALPEGVPLPPPPAVTATPVTLSPSKFAETLRAGRMKRGLSQGDLGEMLSVSQGAVGHWEAGRAVPRKDMIEVLRGLFPALRDVEVVGASSESNGAASHAPSLAACEETRAHEAAVLSMSVETIPWAECGRLVRECNGLNRAISRARVEKFARDASTPGRWPLTHQGIAFDPDGNVIDGQHRLLAHYNAKVDLRTVVCRYLTHEAAREAVIVFDDGRQRVPADSLAIAGVMDRETARQAAAICVVLDGVLNKSRGRDKYVMAELYRKYRVPVDWAVEALPERRFSASLKAAFALAVLVDPERVATFASQVREGSALPGTAASLWNRAASEGLLTSGNSIESRKAACLRALRILKSVLADEPPPKKIYVTEETVLWFLERVKGPSAVLLTVADGSAMVATRSTPSPRGSALRDKICGLLASGLSVRAADVGQALGISRHHAKNLLLKMSVMGEARKLGRGLYAGPAPAC